MLHTVVNTKPGRVFTLSLLIALGCAGCVPIRRLPPTDAPTLTASPSASSTATPSASSVPSATLTPSLTETPTTTSTSSLTFTPSETFTITLTPSRTPIPSPTSTPIIPRISITAAQVACRYGPGAGYNYKIGLIWDNWEDVIGRVQILSRQANGTWAPATWLKVQSFGVPANEIALSKCWVNAEFTRVIRGDINSVPDYFSLPKAPEIYGIPHADEYYRVNAVSARRDGNTVTVFWQPVYMTEDDYVGYMIEAFVCYHGKYWFLPYGYSDSFKQNENESLLDVSLPDEPGCSQPSHAQFFSAEKHGFTTGIIIPWPAFPTPTTESAVPSPTP